MSEDYQTPGKSTRELQRKRYLSKAAIVFFGVGLAFMMYGIFVTLIFPKHQNIIGFLILIATVTIIKIIFSLVEKKGREIQTEIYKATKGAKAEEEIGTILKQLPPQYTTFHDVPSDHGNIDHLVEYNEGKKIFLVETKSHHGKVTREGDKLLIDGITTQTNFIKQALNNAYWLRDKLKEEMKEHKFINTIIVFTNAYVDNRKPITIKNVHVVNKRFLIDKIKELS